MIHTHQNMMKLANPQFLVCFFNTLAYRLQINREDCRTTDWDRKGVNQKGNGDCDDLARYSARCQPIISLDNGEQRMNVECIGVLPYTSDKVPRRRTDPPPPITARMPPHFTAEPKSHARVRKEVSSDVGLGEYGHRFILYSNFENERRCDESVRKVDLERVRIRKIGPMTWTNSECCIRLFVVVVKPNIYMLV